MSDCLLLNQDYRPISVLPLSVINWQHAIKLMFLKKVHVLETYPTWIVHSERLAINVPSVCVTVDYFKYKKNVKFSRYNMYLRDLFQCQYCEEIFDFDELTIDHVIPRSNGGKTEWVNCCTACKPCNHKKGAKLMRPKILPYKPDYYSLIDRWKDLPFTVKQESWNKYLGVDKLVA
jgi:5-methylcytosine-specific restriction endonuclease McrA